MKNPYYNGIVSYHFSVNIKSLDHQACLFVAKKIKDYLSAWAFGCNLMSEHKSANKGEVLNREIQVRFEAYPGDVIAFREGLRCICFHYDLYTENTTVKIKDHEMAPKGSRLHILDENN
jgi:hypothetical protein